MNLAEGDSTRLKSPKFCVALDLGILPLGTDLVETTRNEDKDYRPSPNRYLLPLTSFFCCDKHRELKDLEKKGFL